MSIATGQIITWTDITTSLLSSLKSVCCNIDAYAAGVPIRMQSGQGQVNVKYVTTTVNAGGGAQTFTYKANPVNLISIVTASTVNSEWSTFLSAAGINARSSKIVQAKDFGLAMGLVQQFMSHHLKPVCTRRQIYNTLETNPGIFYGTKYITGSLTPKYTLTAIEPGNIPVVYDSDITNIVNNSIYNTTLDSTPIWLNWGMLNANGNPVPYRSYLSY